MSKLKIYTEKQVSLQVHSSCRQSSYRSLCIKRLEFNLTARNKEALEATTELCRELDVFAYAIPTDVSDKI
jgi:hypothetical protein